MFPVKVAWCLRASCRLHNKSINGFTTHVMHQVYTSKLKILQIIMWNIGMAQKAKETRSGCLVHIVQ